MGDTNWVKNFTPKTDGDADWAAGMRYLFDDANEKIGDVQKAIKCFMRGAQLGNANCMRQLAFSYEFYRFFFSPLVSTSTIRLSDLTHDIVELSNSREVYH